MQFISNSHEAMSDLIYMMNTLVDNKGKILVPGVMDDVAPVTDEELATYSSIDFDLESYKKDIGCKQLLHSDKVGLFRCLFSCRLKCSTFLFI